jgi:hypothetical protein
MKPVPLLTPAKRSSRWLRSPWAIGAAIGAALVLLIIVTDPKEAGQVIGGLFLWAGIIAAYWAPTFTAHRRHVRNQGSIAVLNFFGFVLGITWIVALVLACSDPAPRDQ